MPRAKRTDRTDARRRHRAQYLAATAPDAAADGPSPGAAPTADPRSSRAPTAAPAAAPRRGGVANAFRQAFRPLTLREDLRLLPQLLRHRSFWVPALLAVVVTVAVIAFQGRELISRFGLTYFVFPPPIGAIFLAGFLAPRASYLIGALIGVLSSVLFAIVVPSVPSLFGDATAGEALLSGLATSPLSGVLFGSAAAWYRRFLFLASPARQLERRPGPQRGKPARGARSR